MFLCVVAVMFLRNLFASVIVLSIYSLLAASLFVVMDAVDVAFTEAAVGAGISTILMLATLLYVGQECDPRIRFKPGAALVCIAVGALLMYGFSKLPPYGTANSPVHQYKVNKHYLGNTEKEIGVPNVVTGVLASERGFDTLGEVTVVFCAGIGVLILIGGRPRRGKKSGAEKES